MDAFMTHERIGGLNIETKRIVAACIVAVIMGAFVGCEQPYTPTPKERTKASVPTSSEIASLSEQIKQSVTELEYSDTVAQDFAKMVISWKDVQGRPVLGVWKKQLAKVKEDYKQGRISIEQLAEAEESIVKELGQRIGKELSYNQKFFDLADVIKRKQAQCLSYSQLVYVVGNFVELSVSAINVVELMTGVLPAVSVHTCTIVDLTNGRTTMVDLALKAVNVSKPFKLEKEFAKVGNYWELKNRDNPLGLHRRIQILDRNGLIADIYSNRGVAYDDDLEYTKAISDYTRAIELNPKLAVAYDNRGFTYYNLGQYPKAISDYTKAIELDPKLAHAYCNRGATYEDLGQRTQAISDYTKAIELNPKYTKAYNIRGATYGALGQHTKAISDLTKAIELGSKYAETYLARGTAYALLEKSEEAKKDLLKAVELNPDLEAKVRQISDLFKLSLKLD